MATTAELRQILKEDCEGKNLYDHLTETLMRIMLDRPDKAYDNFELISAQVKSNPLDPDPQVGHAIPLSEEELNKKQIWTNKCAALLKVPEEPPEDSGVKFPDLMDEFNLMEWAGISLGKGDIYRLYLSIKKLSETLPGDVERLRFFGKMFTRGLPYYIVEGISPEEEEGIDETKQEGKAGANKYSYWVSQSPELSQWIKLPNVTMAQVVAARKFQKFLVGNLDAPVTSYPPFPGVEKHLLRTKIARIVGETCISPDGFFELDDSDPPVAKLAESEALNEAFPKAASELKEPDAWKHHELTLNQLGRVTAMPEILDESGEPIEPEEPVEAPQPLESIKPEAWTFRVCPGGAGAASGSLVAARSVLWPGAVAIAAGRRFLNVYIGYGVMYEQSYSPPLPDPIQTEWAPAEEEPGLVEQPDVRADPTPPAAATEEEE